MESMGEAAPAAPLVHPEFKAEIVELCQRGDRSVGQVAHDFDLTETAVREWVKQAGRDAGNREDGGLTSAEQGAGRAAAGEPAAPGGRGDPEAGHGFLREGDPVNCYPFIEAEKAQRRNVKRACELLKVSRAAYYAARAGQPSDRDRADAELTTRIAAEHKRPKGRYGAPFTWRVHRARHRGRPRGPDRRCRQEQQGDAVCLLRQQGAALRGGLRGDGDRGHRCRPVRRPRP